MPHILLYFLSHNHVCVVWTRTMKIGIWNPSSLSFYPQDNVISKVNWETEADEEISFLLSERGSDYFGSAWVVSFLEQELVPFVHKVLL